MPEEFEEETEYFEIKATKDKVSALKTYGGQEIKKLARNLPDTAPVEDDDDYKKLIRKRNNHFLPKKKHAVGEIHVQQTTTRTGREYRKLHSAATREGKRL